MNALLKTAAALMLSAVLMLTSGCASSRLVDIWHDPTFTTPPLSKMLVIAVRKEKVKRRVWEEAFCRSLAKHGMTATPSYQLFPDSPPDTGQVISTVKANSFDGILVVLRLPSETDKQYIPGYTSSEQDVSYFYYWPRYWRYYREIEHPGYVDSQTVDVRAIDVTTTGNGGRLIWSARSRTPDPSEVTDAQKGIVGLVLSDLEQRKIIRSK